MDNEKVLLNISIAHIITFSCENDLIKLKYLSEQEKDNNHEKSLEIQAGFLKISSFEIKVSLNKEKTEKMLSKFQEISSQQCFFNNKVNVFKL